ncbi:MAG: phosphate ABC transporter permease subunit PstC [Pseudomonadota bacterium]
MAHAFYPIPMIWLGFALLAVACLMAFVGGRAAALGLPASGSTRKVQANQFGYFAAIGAGAPILLLLTLFGVFGDTLTRAALVNALPDGFEAMSASDLNLYFDQVTLAANADPTGDILFDAVVRQYQWICGSAKIWLVIGGLVAGACGFLYARSRLSESFRAREAVERAFEWVLFISAVIAIATTAGILMSLVFESFRFFGDTNIFGFLFGLEWNAQTNQDFGALPLFFGTFFIAIIAMAVAAPIGLYAAIYLSEYASASMRGRVKPLLEILAGVPTVVYGFFAIQIVAPLVKSGADAVNSAAGVELLAASPTNALAAGLVMGIMIIPFVSSLSDDVINAVPQNLRDGALAMGATKSETIKQVVMPAALPGVIASLMLAVSRAIGETMIVTMAAGLRSQITLDPTSEITTITVQIVALLTGDSEFDSAKTLSAFALGLVLFIVTLCLNLFALRAVRRYREIYD